MDSFLKNKIFQFNEKTWKQLLVILRKDFGKHCPTAAHMEVYLWKYWEDSSKQFVECFPPYYLNASHPTSNFTAKGLKE